MRNANATHKVGNLAETETLVDISPATLSLLQIRLESTQVTISVQQNEHVLSPNIVKMLVSYFVIHVFFGD